MPRRPIERIPVRERCVRCGRRRRPGGGALCRSCYAKDALATDLARPFPKLSMTREEERQAREAESFGSSVVAPAYAGSICKHGFDDWTECGGCTDAADFDDGLPTGGEL